LAWVLGGIGGLVTLLLLDNRKVPDELVLVLGGFLLGLTFDTN
jgi:hypothetical protein